jgi:hypothetical protein
MPPGGIAEGRTGEDAGMLTGRATARRRRATTDIRIATAADRHTRAEQ